MKEIIKNNYKFILGVLLGLVISITTVYAIDAYIESNKVAYNNHNKSNVEEAIDELYEKSGIHKDKWVDPILNGADPVFDKAGKLIPVEIKDNGDVYYASLNSEWYNYSEKRWAVILVDSPSNTNYKVGDHILESDIESYFVWIPRYQYKIWNLGQYTDTIDLSNMQNSEVDKDTSYYKIYGEGHTRIIDIKFGNVEKTPKMAESEAAIGKFYTHPAFTLGDKDLNGFWIGKFEIGYKGADSTTSAQVNNEEKDSVIIKPDVYSWRGIKVRNMFMTSYNYERDLDSHMLKNTEWGAVAYLSHSAYGTGKKININNASDYKTGYSAVPGLELNKLPIDYGQSTDETITQPWNNPIGYLASTTGNISVVYDISGGCYENLAAYRPNSVETGSGFSEADFITYAKYFNFYNESTEKSYNKRILGDATGEMGPFYSFTDSDGRSRVHQWHGELGDFVYTNLPWFSRGCNYSCGLLAGSLYFAHVVGYEKNEMGFRLALAI